MYSPDYRIQDDDLLLLWIIIGFLFADEETIGYDPMMCHGDNGEILGITVDGTEYTVLKRLFLADTLKGHATQCWWVERDGK